MKLTIYLAGDSTVSNYPPEKEPMMGWGQRLGQYFDDSVVIRNEAMGGRSSKSFIDEGRLAAIEQAIVPGDYLLIQFGHNDEKADEARHTDVFGTYEQYLRQYIGVARAKGATPVLITSTERRYFDESGKLKDTHGAYPAAMARLAAEERVPVIDLQAKSRKLLEAMGDESSKRLFVWLAQGEHPNYPKGSCDNTHFNEQGAAEMAKLVAEGIRETGLPLAERLIGVS
ncbi:rhamnogalacturonan acetylesterase [Paenibacillus mesophilus]|uniref:rhamnogalacturonan acetylesterase n=1 Tax=Paenibacillus mesophilus TaxID=2582849 RepID=UPI001EE472CE|nr:rhamnogalacturonan acetylesterase [Paenibacillus mesophilus]